VSGTPGAIGAPGAADIAGLAAPAAADPADEAPGFTAGPIGSPGAPASVLSGGIGFTGNPDTSTPGLGDNNQGCNTGGPSIGATDTGGTGGGGDILGTGPLGHGGGVLGAVAPTGAEGGVTLEDGTVVPEPAAETGNEIVQPEGGLSGALDILGNRTDQLGQIGNLAQQEQDLLAQWAQVIPQNDPRWNEVVTFVQQQVWGQNQMQQWFPWLFGGQGGTPPSGTPAAGNGI